MALTGFQRVLLRVLACNRSPNSVFAGGTTLNRGRARAKSDVLLAGGAGPAGKDSVTQFGATAPT